MNEQSSFDVVLRGLLALIVFLVVIALCPLTSDPTSVKIIVYHWGAAACVVVLAMGGWNRQRRGRGNIFLLLLAIFLILYTVSALHSSFPGNSLVEVSKYLSLFLIYYVAMRVFASPKDVAPLLLAVCVGLACSSAYALFQKAGLDPFPWDPRFLASDSYTELPGTFGNPNLAAHALILGEIFAVYLASRGGRWRLCLGFVVIFVTHHLLTGQRAGWVALGAALSLLVAAHIVRRHVTRPVQAMVVSLVLTGMIGAIGLATVMGVTKWKTGTPYPLDMALLIRYKSYCSASAMILERPVLGFGPGNYRIENAAYWTRGEQRWFAEDGKKNDNAHHDILECGVDAGVPAAVLYMGLLATGMGFGLLYAFRHNDAHKRRFGYMCAAFFCAFGVDGLFGFNLRVPVSGLLLFVMAGALDGVWRAERSSHDARDSTGGRRWIYASLLALLAVGNAAFGTWVFYSELLYQRGLGALEWKAYREAEDVLARGEALAPWNWLFGFQRGAAARGLQQPHAAVEHFTRSLERYPNRIPTLLALADTHLQYAEALKRIGGEGALPPQSPRMRGEGIDASPLEQALDAADGVAQRALTLCPFKPEPHAVLGRTAALREGDQWVEKAKAHLAKAVDLGVEEQGELLALLADLHMQTRRYDDANACLMRAVQADPTCASVWNSYWRFAVRHEGMQSFRDHVLAVVVQLEEGGKHVPGFLRAAACGYDEGAGAIDRALELLAQDAAGLGKDRAWVAHVLWMEAKSAPARTTGTAYLNLGTLFLSLGDAQTATDVLAQAMVILRDTEYRLVCAEAYATALAKLGRYADVEAFLKAEMQTHPTLREMYADALAEQGKYIPARQAYQTVLEFAGLDATTQHRLLEKLKVLGTR